MTTQTREDHLGWCKQRALELVDMGDLPQAFTSMIKDLSEHDATKNHVGIRLGMMLMMAGHLASYEKMRDFILGFN